MADVDWSALIANSLASRESKDLHGAGMGLAKAGRTQQIKKKEASDANNSAGPSHKLNADRASKDEGNLVVKRPKDGGSFEATKKSVSPEKKLAQRGQVTATQDKNSSSSEESEELASTKSRHKASAKLQKAIDPVTVARKKEKIPVLDSSSDDSSTAEKTVVHTKPEAVNKSSISKHTEPNPSHANLKTTKKKTTRKIVSVESSSSDEENVSTRKPAASGGKSTERAGTNSKRQETSTSISKSEASSNGAKSAQNKSLEKVKPPKDSTRNGSSGKSSSLKSNLGDAAARAPQDDQNQSSDSWWKSLIDETLAKKETSPAKDGQVAPGKKASASAASKPKAVTLDPSTSKKSIKATELSSSDDELEATGPSKAPKKNPKEKSTKPAPMKHAKASEETSKRKAKDDRSRSSDEDDEDSSTIRGRKSTSPTRKVVRFQEKGTEKEGGTRSSAQKEVKGKANTGSPEGTLDDSWWASLMDSSIATARKGDQEKDRPAVQQESSSEKRSKAKTSKPKQSAVSKDIAKEKVEGPPKKQQTDDAKKPAAKNRVEEPLSPWGLVIDEAIAEVSLKKTAASVGKNSTADTSGKAKSAKGNPSNSPPSSPLMRAMEEAVASLTPKKNAKAGKSGASPAKVAEEVSESGNYKKAGTLADTLGKAKSAKGNPSNSPPSSPIMRAMEEAVASLTPKKEAKAGKTGASPSKVADKVSEAAKYKEASDKTSSSERSNSAGNGANAPKILGNHPMKSSKRESARSSEGEKNSKEKKKDATGAARVTDSVSPSSDDAFKIAMEEAVAGLIPTKTGKAAKDKKVAGKQVEKEAKTIKKSKKVAETSRTVVASSSPSSGDEMQKAMEEAVALLKARKGVTQENNNAGSIDNKFVTGQKVTAKDKGSESKKEVVPQDNVHPLSALEAKVAVAESRSKEKAPKEKASKEKALKGKTPKQKASVEMAPEGKTLDNKVSNDAVSKSNTISGKDLKDIAKPSRDGSSKRALQVEEEFVNTTRESFSKKSKLDGQAGKRNDVASKSNGPEPSSKLDAKRASGEDLSDSELGSDQEIESKVQSPPRSKRLSEIAVLDDSPPAKKASHDKISTKRPTSMQRDGDLDIDSEGGELTQGSAEALSYFVRGFRRQSRGSGSAKKKSKSKHHTDDA